MADGDVLTKVAGHQAFAAPAAPVVTAADVTYDPAVLGETDGQAVAEALAAASSPLSIATLPLSSANILALQTGAQTIIAASPGHIFWPVAASLIFTAGAALYVLPPDQLIVVGWSTTVTGPLQWPTAGWLDGAGSTFVVLPYNMDPGAQFFDLASISGASLDVWLDAGDPTDGNGTASLIVLYRDITV